VNTVVDVALGVQLATANALAFRTVNVLMMSGPEYSDDVDVGSVPSVVYRTTVLFAALVIVTDWAVV
jgi:hypothetical protein